VTTLVFFPVFLGANTTQKSFFFVLLADVCILQYLPASSFIFDDGRGDFLSRCQLHILPSNPIIFSFAPLVLTLLEN